VGLLPSEGCGQDLVDVAFPQVLYGYIAVPEAARFKYILM
jgi:hypothetical protein